ncbi:beta-galactosidase [Actinomyces sp. Z5]|uniref:beta-galactosidase n=1 Tax=Actinomyces sp. Z5 TaxID=2250216 RepID=UPI000DCCF160|nr:beta-galactosidase [Actinomyces sp. Z5]RAX18907.1 beta-galactosidase [Actinomyces sp. Z5]
MTAFPRRPSRDDSALHYGADYNPEQWPRETWREDIALMQEAGVTVVTLAVFSWARIQPTEDTWDFTWLDEIIDMLSKAGIDVDLATSTASPPAWLTMKHPEVLPVTYDGHILWQGGRQHWRPTSPLFRQYALEVTRRLAERYGHNPAVVAWHVNNELGGANVFDYSDDAAAAFRAWLRGHYDDLEDLNAAWGTSFWSQHYARWEEILPPRQAGAQNNPGQVLDFQRFSGDALRDHLAAETAILHELSPGVPVTTNLMLAANYQSIDYSAWARDTDFISNDHYLLPGEGGIEELAFSASATSAIADGEPWWLMEHATSAVNWRTVNPAKRPGQLRRDSLTHLGHGADAICFFQWRASAAGGERFHSAMVPHAGRHSRVFREVTALGRELRSLREVAGSPSLPARCALVFDYETWLLFQGDSMPDNRIEYREELVRWYRVFADLGLRVDVVCPQNDLARYDFLAAPLLHLVPSTLAARLREAVESGTHLVTTYFSGIADEHARVYLGGYPGALRGLLGVRVDEMRPLLDGTTLMVDGGGTMANGLAGSWCEPVEIVSPEVEVLRTYSDCQDTLKAGLQPGTPAVTRRTLGRGSAAYVSTRLEHSALSDLLAELIARAGITADLPTPLAGEVIASVRRGDQADYWTLTNRGRVDLGPADDVAALLGGTVLGGAHTLGLDDAIVVRVPRR